MHETVQLVLYHVRMVWRFRWIALVAAVVVCVAGWVGVLLLPDQFQVKTKVYLDTRSLLRPVLKGLAIDSRIQEDTAVLMRQTLLVRPNLETVARKTDMDLEAKTPEQFEGLLISLAKHIDVSGSSKDNIFEISYVNADPKRAAAVVQALLNILVEKSLGDTRKDTSKTRQFIEAQLADYDAKLTQEENRIKEFKQKNVGLMPSDGKTYYERLEQLKSQRADAELQLRELEKQRDALNKELSGEEPTFGLVPTPAPVAPQAADRSTPLDGRISDAEKRLDQLLLQYTDKHPDVIATRHLVEDLKKQRDQYLKDHPPPPPPRPVVAAQGSSDPAENPVYQELKVKAGELEGQVAALKERVDEFKKREQELSRMVDLVPKVEAEFTRLNRDYAVNRQHYDELLKRREALKLSNEAGQTGDEFQFNVIEPPRVPLVPIGPKRQLLSTMVLFGGIGAGIGFAWLLAMMRPTVYSKTDFATIADLPVLGEISRMWTRPERVRRRMEVASFACGCVCLLGLFAGLMGLYFLNVDIVGKASVIADHAARLTGRLL